MFEAKALALLPRPILATGMRQLSIEPYMGRSYIKKAPNVGGLFEARRCKAEAKRVEVSS